MFWESVAIALDGLRTNKLRAALTMLGIIIGVAAVIAMVSLGLGVRDSVQKSITSLGSNLLIVVPGATSPTGMRQAAGSNTSLKNGDAGAILRDVPGVAFVAPTVQRSYQTIYGNKNWTTTVQGSTPDILEVRNFRLQEGSFFGRKELDTRSRVAVLGRTVADNLFGEVTPLGKTIRIQQAPFLVIGVLEPKGQSAGGGDQDDLVLVPLTTAQERLLGITYLNAISVQAESAEVLNKVQEDIVQVLRKRHRLSAGAPEDFTINNMTAVLESAQEATGNITALLGAIAAISLLVGGIGIMNIMLVSVTERTREIGVRKALGATRRHILLQFLIESMVIGVTGGLAGVALGVGVSMLISSLAGWNTVLSWPAVLVAFGFSLATGLFFGIYPARKAAALDPIEALRYE